MGAEEDGEDGGEGVVMGRDTGPDNAPSTTGTKRSRPQSLENSDAPRPSKRGIRSGNNPSPSVAGPSRLTGHALTTSSTAVQPLMSTHHSDRRSDIPRSTPPGHPLLSTAQARHLFSLTPTSEQVRNVEQLRIFNASAESITRNIHYYQVARATWEREQALYHRQVEAELEFDHFHHSVNELFRSLMDDLRGDPRILNLRQEIYTILEAIERSKI
ncbi:hypothetical protein HYPSUDRAFT_209965 [Hypholoma sublateritium FD-334 SS-4]|nr:hypothetical protein HYPSUDRAFT_209965 [Hypholoma sublateritium FD-334 SS-4]